MATDPTITALKAAVKGLTYESESDEPFVAFAWRAADVGDGLSQKKVRTLGGHGAKEPVEEQTPDEFFAPLVRSEDWHGAEEKEVVERYRKLAETIGTLLEHPRVYKVGDGPEKTIYVVGKAKSGDWAGVKTTAIET
ncbi:MAG: Nuclease inhibitor family protein [Gemmataceae bacterium]|nr:Nuclease inhibitor family protein [Gemmataceae bacterium]